MRKIMITEDIITNLLKDQQQEINECFNLFTSFILFD